MQPHYEDILHISKELREILAGRMKGLGVETDPLFRGFLRDVANILSLRKISFNLPEVNDRLNLLGWQEMELDYRSLELIQTCLEYRSH